MVSDNLCPVDPCSRDGVAMTYEPSPNYVFVAYAYVDGIPEFVKVLGRDQVNAQLYCQANGYELGIIGLTIL